MIRDEILQRFEKRLNELEIRIRVQANAIGVLDTRMPNQVRKEPLLEALERDVQELLKLQK